MEFSHQFLAMACGNRFRKQFLEYPAVPDPVRVCFQHGNMLIGRVDSYGCEQRLKLAIIAYG